MNGQFALGQEDATRYRRVRFALGLVGLAVLVGRLAYLGALPGGLGVVVLSGGPPLLGYVFGVRSLAGSVFAGLAMLAVIIGTTLYVIGEAASSTAALGYLTLPLVGIPLVLVTAFLERAIRSPSGSVVAGLGVLAVTVGTMLYLTAESSAESFCDHANGLGNTMIEVGDGPLTASGAERLVAFQPNFVRDSEALREDGFNGERARCGSVGGGPGKHPRCKTRRQTVVQGMTNSGGWSKTCTAARAPVPTFAELMYRARQEGATIR
jgi:hypothetical protein